LKAQGQKVINIQFPTLNDDQKFYLKKKYLKFLIDCGHQLELSKCEYFKEFVTTLNPLFEVPTDESLSYLAVNLYDIAIDALKKIFQKTDKICLTCNFWKSKGHGIIVITANWISDDYKHQEAFLTLEEIDFPFTPISIKKKNKRDHT
ncbi:8281_t:CDS:1, partial [Funneliformis mosseae]